MQLWGLKEVFYGRLYTPLYKKGIKETQNKPMETTHKYNSITMHFLKSFQIVKFHKTNKILKQQFLILFEILNSTVL